MYFYHSGCPSSGHERVISMKLFNNFEAVKFPEENLILITHQGYLYYIYKPKYSFWQKHKNAGNDHITVENYPDVTPEELRESLNGIFPQKETDLLRFCRPRDLNIRDMLALLEEDYPVYMSDSSVHSSVHSLLLESVIVYKSYLMLRKLLDDALASTLETIQVFNMIRKLSFSILGRNIYKEEIGIVDGHDSSSYFWIMPVRIIDYSDTNSVDNVAEMKSTEISIEEDDIAQFLSPFLFRHFDPELEANRKRVDSVWENDVGTEEIVHYKNFDWNLTYNFYTYDTVSAILDDIKDTIDALLCGRVTEFTVKLREKRGWAAKTLLYAKGFTQDQIDEYNANRPTSDDTDAELIIDFYRRFIYRMEYMMKVGKEKGFDLISFMGP